MPTSSGSRWTGKPGSSRRADSPIPTSLGVTGPDRPRRIPSDLATDGRGSTLPAPDECLWVRLSIWERLARSWGERRVAPAALRRGATMTQDLLSGHSGGGEGGAPMTREGMQQSVEDVPRPNEEPKASGA